MRFLLVRHAESEWNAERRWQGHADPPLSDRGREQARTAARHLSGFEGPVVASDLVRAVETAEIIASELGLGPVHIEPGMREIDVGGFSGLTADEVARRLPEAHADWKAGRLETYPDGESRTAHPERILDALARLAAEHDGDVLVVTHGGCITAIERHVGVHPGKPSTNLTARWFRWEDGLHADSDRIQLADAAPPAARRVH